MTRADPRPVAADTGGDHYHPGALLHLTPKGPPMRCASCDTENDDGSKFCMTCGSPLDAPTEPTPTDTGQSAPPPVPMAEAPPPVPMVEAPLPVPTDDELRSGEVPAAGEGPGPDAPPPSGDWPAAESAPPPPPTADHAPPPPSGEWAAPDHSAAPPPPPPADWGAAPSPPPHEPPAPPPPAAAPPGGWEAAPAPAAPPAPGMPPSPPGQWGTPAPAWGPPGGAPQPHQQPQQPGQWGQPAHGAPPQQGQWGQPHGAPQPPQGFAPQAPAGPPDPNALGAAAARIGNRPRKDARAAFAVAGVSLEEGEQVEALAAGKFQGNPALLILTDRALLLVDDRPWKPHVERIGLEPDLQVQGMQDRTATLTLFRAHNQWVLDQIVDTALAVEMAQRIRYRTGTA